MSITLYCILFTPVIRWQASADGGIAEIRFVLLVVKCNYMPGEID